jgi:hypothetical protein
VPPFTGFGANSKCLVDTSSSTGLESNEDKNITKRSVKMSVISSQNNALAEIEEF